MKSMKIRKLISMFLCMTMLAPTTFAALPVRAQEKTQRVSSSLGVQRDIGEPGIDYIDGEIIVKFKAAISGIIKGQAVNFWGDIDCIVTDAFNIDHEDQVLTDDRYVDINMEGLFKSCLADLIILKSETLSTKDLLAKLAGLEDIEYVEPNYIQKIDDEVKIEIPQFNDVLSSLLKIGGSGIFNAIGIKENLVNDPDFDLQWGLKNTGRNLYDIKNKSGNEIPIKACVDINVESVWFRGITGDKNTVIAVMDTGIDYNHEDLKENLWNNSHSGCGYSAIYDGKVDEISGELINCLENKYMNKGKHGTNVAGIIGAIGNNGKDISGVMQDVQIMPICVGDDDAMDKAAILKGLFFLEDRLENGIPIKAVNMSFGCYERNEFDNEIEKKINKLGEKYGVLFICGAGNDGKELNEREKFYPACLDSDYIISVGAINPDGKLSSFSNFGEEEVDVLAPGSMIKTIFPVGIECKFTAGTSMAASFITGSVGLLTAYSEVNSENWTPEQIKDKVINGANTFLGTDLNKKSVSDGFFQLDKAITYPSDKSEGWQWIGDDKKGHWTYENNSTKSHDNTSKCYFDEESGHIVTGWKFINEQWYYFNNEPGAKEGQMMTGWIKDNSALYYCDKNTGALVTGWFVDPDTGDSYYFHENFYNEAEIHEKSDYKLGQMETGWIYDWKSRKLSYLSKYDDNKGNLGRLIFKDKIIPGSEYTFVDSNKTDITIKLDYFADFNDYCNANKENHYSFDDYNGPDVIKFSDYNNYFNMDYDGRSQVIIKNRFKYIDFECICVIPYDLSKLS